MAVQEDHDLPHDLLLGPKCAWPNRAAACRLTKPIWLGLDDVEDLLSERFNHPLGVNRPDASDHFSIPSIELGAEVLRKRALNC